MRFKGTLALFVILVALGAYVYLTDVRGREEREQQEADAKLAFHFDADDIVEIRLEFPDHTIAGVKHGVDQWEITSPPGIEPDNEEWNLLASNIPRVEREDTVAANPTDLAQYGLENPMVRVVAKTADGATHELLIGAENPRKIYNYARLGDSPEVFLTPSSWGRIFQKTVTDLRNKKVLEFDDTAITSIRIEAGGRETRFEKSGEDWHIRAPVDARADNSEIGTFLNTIRFARATSFPDDTVDAAAAGLGSPALRITLSDGSAQHVLAIGKSVDENGRYAQNAAKPTIFIIDNQIADKASRPVFDWRDKHITRVDRNAVDTIEIRRGNESLALTRDGADWKLGDGSKAQWDKVSAMFNALEFDQASEIIDTPGALRRYGLENPRLEVVFRQAGNETGRIRFGSDRGEDAVYLNASGDPAVKVVSRDVYDRFDVAADELVEPPASEQ